MKFHSRGRRLLPAHRRSRVVSRGSCRYSRQGSSRERERVAAEFPAFPPSSSFSFSSTAPLFQQLPLLLPPPPPPPPSPPLVPSKPVPVPTWNQSPPVSSNFLFVSRKAAGDAPRGSLPEGSRLGTILFPSSHLLLPFLYLLFLPLSPSPSFC
uniref:Uncharacterized protein n=1 Tax=Vespula pensylvanica TaxID=30213 RepID=A0A834UCQ9_VESPE|nr:hypothetical protein H0235_004252 [Vespula pensylvanica]